MVLGLVLLLFAAENCRADKASQLLGVDILLEAPRQVIDESMRDVGDGKSPGAGQVSDTETGLPAGATSSLGKKNHAVPARTFALRVPSRPATSEEPVDLPKHQSTAFAEVSTPATRIPVRNLEQDFNNMTLRLRRKFFDDKEIQRHVRELETIRQRVKQIIEHLPTTAATKGNSQAIDERVGKAVDPEDIDKRVAKAVDPQAIDERVGKAVDPQAIDKRVAKAVDPQAIDKRVAKAVDPQAIDRRVAKAVDPQAIDRRVAKAVDPQAIDERVGKAVDPEDIKQLIDGAFNPDDLLEKLKAVVDGGTLTKEASTSVDKSLAATNKNLKQVQLNLQTGVQHDLDDIKKKVEKAVSDAFDKMENVFARQATLKVLDWAKDINAWAAISIPPITYDHHRKKYCSRHCFGHCCKHDYHHYKTKNPASVAANAAAKAKKDAAKAKADAALNVARGYQAEIGNLADQKQTVLRGIDDEFPTVASLASQTIISDQAIAVPAQHISTDDTDAQNKNTAVARVGHGAGDDGNTAFVEIDGKVRMKENTVGAVAAAVGYNSQAEMEINTLGSSGAVDIRGNYTAEVTTNALVAASVGEQTTATVRVATLDNLVAHANVKQKVTADGAVAATIGADSTATVAINNVGADQKVTTYGNYNSNVSAMAPVAAAIGSGSQATINIAGVNGLNADTFNQKVSATGAVAAAIGYGTTATVDIGSLEGTIHGTAVQNVGATNGATAAAIGSHSSAQLRIGNIDKKASINGGMSGFDVNQTGPAVAASIGGRTKSLISVGNINAHIGGSVNHQVVTDSITCAALGLGSTATVKVGDVNANVAGKLTTAIKTGDILTMSAGAKTDAEILVGVIDKPVHGNASVNITTGDLLAGTVGINSEAGIYIGYVNAAVNGDLDMQISTGDVTSMSLALSDKTKIGAITSVGSVWQDTRRKSIKVSTGDIYTLGFGFSFTIPVINQTITIADQGCTHIGNVGGAPCD
ncbi:MAG: hypothetical protein JW773_13870 [Desulfuromonadales bacterium]|nr:hypothetical protein [Desulfuromonadales bacterium]